MINSLYPIFRHWSEKGSVYLISDTHFADSDCKLMDSEWISPEEQVSILQKYIHKNDTLIHLGDVGNPEYLKNVKGYKVLIMGNHDQSIKKYQPYFNEVYSGPLFISDKILLSHEPINRNLEFCFNFHGHDHNPAFAADKYQMNLAANVCGYTPVNLGKLIKDGILSNIDSLHRITIDRASGLRY